MIELMLSMLLVEVPHLDKTKVLDGLNEISTIDAKVGASGKLHGSEVDPVVLAGIQWFEGRFNPRPRDGDCTTSCSAVGAMQIATSNRSIIPRWSEAEEHGFLSPVTIEEMRTPTISVRLGYTILHHWKNECGGTLGVWLTAYGWGRCPGSKNKKISKGYVDREGVRRCAVITAMLERLDRKPEGWRCGHERRRVPRRTARLVRRISGG